MLREIGLFAFWVLAVLIAAWQGNWYYEAKRRPLNEIRTLLGSVPDGAHVIAFRDSMSVRGGSLLWNVRVPESAALTLRSRCQAPANIRGLDLPPLIEVAPPDAPTAENLTSDRQQAASPRPRGCILAARNVPDLVVTTVTLQGDIMQVETLL